MRGWIDVPIVEEEDEEEGSYYLEKREAGQNLIMKSFWRKYGKVKKESFF